MTQKQFEETFAARKAAYQAKSAELEAKAKALHAERMALSREFHQGNAELEELRRQTIVSKPMNVRKHECFCLQNKFSGVLGDWTRTKQLDCPQATVHFDCCSDDAAVFTIRIPYLQPKSEEA